ncbi:hypothetical protein DL771_008741 [Monosporascus sp. 5C6A]|nr:hypothetical protein DL771_008741 [Monosporascus sp. 5C6A]
MAETPACPEPDDEDVLDDDERQKLRAFPNLVDDCSDDDDDGKFRHCIEARDDILGEHAELALRAAIYERVMLSRCSRYKTIKEAVTTSAATVTEDSRDEQWELLPG